MFCLLHVLSINEKILHYKIVYKYKYMSIIDAYMYIYYTYLDIRKFI